MNLCFVDDCQATPVTDMPPETLKIEKMTRRDPPTSKKSEKQRFGTHRRSENRKNSSSAGAEDEKIQKTELRSGAKQ